jgi:hypothetical protein
MTMNDNCYYQITDFKLTGADTVRFSFSVDAQCNVLGCYTTPSAQDNYSLYVVTSGVGRYLRYNGGTYRSDVTASTRYNVEITPTGSTGLPVASSWEQQEFESQTDFCIGTSNATVSSAKFVGSLYGAIEVVGRAKFIPCERFSDGEIGFYDTYTGTFYEPVGTRPASLGYDNSYKSITVSGPIETIWAHSKNLLDMSDNNIVLGYYINNSGERVYNASNFYNQAFIPVSADTTYTWSTSSNINYINFMEYDVTKTFLKRTLIGSPAGTSGQFTTRNDTAYVLIGSNPFGGSLTMEQIQAVNWQFELGSTATEYQPYYDGGTATAEMLLKVGDYADEQEIISGVVTRNVGVKVLDGTENWVEFSSNVIIRNAAANWGAIAGLGGFCTHLTVLKSGETIFAGSCRFATDFNVYDYKTAFGVNNITRFKQYLAEQYAAGTPVILLYPLATPTTETVTGQTLQVTDGDNVLEITQASLTGLELEAQYNAAVSLTIQEVQDANLDNNVTVTIQ